MSLTRNIANTWQNNGSLGKLVIIVPIAALIVTFAFAGYYYWDRYVYIGDQSPLELGVTSLEEAVRENPQDPDARLALAQFYFHSGAYDEAISQAEQTLQAFPENDGALLIIGLSNIQSGKREEAIEPLEAFADARGQLPTAKGDDLLETSLYFLGESYIQLGRPSDAIEVLEQALTINRTDADAMYQLGLAYAQTGEYGQALDQYHNAVRFVPDFTEAYSGMIESYAALSQSSHVAYARGMEAFSQKDYETATIHLEAAARELPDFAPAHLGLGLVLEKNGEYQAAIASLQRALELDPNNFMATNALGRIRQTQSSDSQ